MKKIVAIASLLLMSFQIAFAQSETDDLRRQMQQLQEQMHKMMEQFSQDFGGNFFFFDTTFVKDFNGNGFRFDTSFVREFRFDGENFPFDTAFMQEFHWDNLGDGGFKIDTFFMEEYRSMEPGAFPNEFFNGEWSQNLRKMMEQMMEQFDGQQFNFDGMDEFFKNLEPQGTDPRSGQPKPEESPALKKKRKTTIL